MDHEDANEISSAASSINITAIGKKFKPTYTHQVFREERIRGYEPLSERTVDVTKEAKAPDGEAPRETNGTRQISIDIELAPSCRICSIEYRTREPTIETDSDGPPRKRAKFECSAVDGTSRDEGKVGDDSKSEASPLTVDEISSRLQLALPPTIPSDHETSVSDDYLTSLVGDVLREYNIGRNEFVICLADGKDEAVAAYHNSVQNLALWFIESAEAVDIASDNGGGFWKVLYLFQKHVDAALPTDGPKYSLLGYITVFHFHSPFKKPRPGQVIRICQALILPPHQRCGHGRNLLSCVYDHMLHSHDSLIVEITVEDPAPAFSMLRDKIDLDILLRDDSHAEIKRVFERDLFIPISEKELIQNAASLKITPKQMLTVYELFKFHRINDATRNNTNEGDKRDSFKKYRLMVKKRLLKVHREDLGRIKDGVEKRRQLDQLFRSLFLSYCQVLGKDASEWNNLHVKPSNK